MNRIIEGLREELMNYRPIPFWSWNDRLEPEKLVEQIRWMYTNGIGGFFMHARRGLETPYLEEEWFRCIELCCKEGKRLGMNAWVYDENGWPSGFVGGKLLNEEKNRAMYILKKYGSFDEIADASYLLEEERIIRVDKGEEGRQYLNLYLKSSPSAVDILNPYVVEQFLNETHQKYKEYFGNAFVKMLKGFFTDEPQYYRWDVPYTPMVAEYFGETYQEDLMENLGLLFVEKEGYREFRYRYWKAMQQLMLKNFAQKVFRWCEQHGVQLTGHYVDEITMGNQIMCCGGVMPFYEYEHIPGIDWLGRKTDNELAPRQLASVGAQLGKKQLLTETFGCCGWDVSPAELRRIAGFQYANGVNMMCHHLIPYSERGQRKIDCPVHFSGANPWVKESFKDFNDYFTRLGYLLTESTQYVNVALLHPIRSAYFDYKREDEQSGFGIQGLDKKLQSVCRMFSGRGISYHFLDETLLEKYGFVEEGKIGCGNCIYTYLVLPSILNMDFQTERLVHEFVRQGGKVLILDNAPAYLEGKPYSYKYLKNTCTLQEIVDAQPFQVKETDHELYCAYRLIDEKPFLFIQNASADKSYTQTFVFKDGSKSFLALDLVTLQMKRMPLTVTLQENGALLLFPNREEAPLERVLQNYTLQFQEAKLDFLNNFLTIDEVSWSQDGKNYTKTMPCRKAFQELLDRRYEGKIHLKYEFEIQKMPDKLTLLAEIKKQDESRINGHAFVFEKAWEEDSALYMTDITDWVRVGKNEYEVILNWHQSESTYYALFGENVTESLRNCITYESELEAVYLMGRFGVYSHQEYEEQDECTVCGGDFYIGETPKQLSEPTMEGLPFFRGSFSLTQNIHLSCKNVCLRLKGRYAQAKVWVNGQYAGKLFFEHSLDISEYAIIGENEIKASFIVGNRNLLGPFHCAWTEEDVFPGIFEISNLPNTEDGKARYRLFRFYEKNGKESL